MTNIPTSTDLASVRTPDPDRPAPTRYRCRQCQGTKKALIQTVPGVMVTGACPSCDGRGWVYNAPAEPLSISKAEVLALFTLAEIPIKDIHEIANGYWPDSYAELRAKSPWWLVETYRGMIKIGARKRVYEINWSKTGAESVVTEDDVTKGETHVHAWDLLKLQTYLNRLSHVLVETCPGHVWGDNSHAKHDRTILEQCSVCGALQPAMYRGEA